MACVQNSIEWPSWRRLRGCGARDAWQNRRHRNPPVARLKHYAPSLRLLDVQRYPVNMLGCAAGCYTSRAAPDETGSSCPRPPPHAAHAGGRAIKRSLTGANTGNYPYHTSLYMPHNNTLHRNGFGLPARASSYNSPQKSSATNLFILPLGFHGFPLFFCTNALQLRHCVCSIGLCFLL